MFNFDFILLYIITTTSCLDPSRLDNEPLSVATGSLALDQRAAGRDVLTLSPAHQFL
jgi:hypothetical protein